MTIIEHGKTWEGFPYASIIVEGYAFPGDLDTYAIGIDEPNYKLPAIRYEIEILHDRVILWTKLYGWTCRYLALTSLYLANKF